MFDYHMGFVVAVCFLKLLIMDVESAPEHSTPRLLLSESQSWQKDGAAVKFDPRYTF